MGLGLPPRPMMMEGTIPEHSSPTTTIPSPVAPMRRLAKSFSVATSTSNVSKGIYDCTQLFYSCVC